MRDLFPLINFVILVFIVGAGGVIVLGFAAKIRSLEYQVAAAVKLLSWVPGGPQPAGGDDGTPA